MKWFARMERKFGRYAIHNLMLYMVAVSLAGTILGFVNPSFYYTYLSLDVYQIIHAGQIWRIVTFLFYPSVSLQSSGFLINLLFYAIMLYVYYSIGRVLERIWGSFRFNAFYFTGILLILFVTFVYYNVLVHANGAALARVISYSLAQYIDLNNLNLSMFLVFAFLFPDTQFLLYFIVPIKAKWLGYFYLAYNLYEIIMCVLSKDYRNIMVMLLIVAALIDFVIFYIIARNPQGIGATVKQKKRRVVYRNKAAEGRGPVARHRCAICGRTELDAPQLEFRYCSKCDGNYEYCSEHLFTHEHVKH
jgi:hypothetical protein